MRFRRLLALRNSRIKNSRMPIGGKLPGAGGHHQHRAMPAHPLTPAPPAPGLRSPVYLLHNGAHETTQARTARQVLGTHAARHSRAGPPVERRERRRLLRLRPGAHVEVNRYNLLTALQDHAASHEIEVSRC